MSDLRKFIAASLLILLLIFITIKLFEESKRTSKFKKIVLTTDNTIINRTNQNYLDTIVNVGLKKLNVKGVNIIIYPLTKSMKENFGRDYDLKAHVRRVNIYYYIWIDDMSRYDAIGTIGHELLHIKQYYEDKLVITDEVIFWMDEPYKIDEMEYRTRPWEIDVFEKQEIFRQELMKDLFN